MFILAQTMPSLIIPYSCEWKLLTSYFSAWKEMFQTEFLTEKKRLIELTTMNFPSLPVSLFLYNIY